MLIDTDVPYLEPLWRWLRGDEKLKKYFTEASFFMPHNDMVSAAIDAIQSKCPAPRALWIIPNDTRAVTKKPGCKSPGNHIFYITIIIQCIRDQFQVAKEDGEVRLQGQFMELSEIRKHVKESVLRFHNDYVKKGGKAFENLYWTGDQMFYPPEDKKGFLITASEFQVTIF